MFSQGSDLDTVFPKYGPIKSALMSIGLWPDPEKGADRKLGRAVDALVSAVDSLDTIAYIKTSDSLLTFMEDVNEAAGQLQSALSQDELGNATGEQVQKLKNAMQLFYDAYSQIESFEVGEMTAWGSAATTVRNFPFSLRYLMEEVPTLLDLPAIEMSYTSY